MDTGARTEPLVVIVGQTASGKSALAVKLARQFEGEIICADSRTVYRGLDVGTAKPSSADRAAAAHHLLDVVDPDQTFTAAKFKQMALRAIASIAARGKLPILVGGSGLYIDAVLFDYQFVAPPVPAERARLQKLTVEELQAELLDRGLPLPQNQQNPRHLIRALEIGGLPQERGVLQPNTLILGLRVPKDELRQRIVRRVDEMLDHGLLAEVEQAGQRYDWNVPALQAPAYRAFRPYLEGVIDLEQAKANFAQNDMHLAKRQATWFKRNKSIQWLDNPSEIVDIVTTFLSKIHE